MLADFHLLRPWWLLILIPAIVLLLLLRYYRFHASPWHQLIAPHLQAILLNGQRLLQKQPWALPLLMLCWLLAAIALAGPSWQKLAQPAFALKKATILVLDMSLSMRATDMVPDRLTQQRFSALDFTEQLAEGELALLSFAGDAFVLSPLTPDHNNIRLLIPDLRPEIMPVQGSNLLAALQQADALLQQAGYPQGDVVVFTDGFDRNSYQEIQDLISTNWPHRLSILGFGTEDGAPVRLENGELLKNAQGAVVLPRVPHNKLAQLAHRKKGIYARAGVGSTGIEQIIDLPPLSSLDTTDKMQQIKGDQWQDSAIYLVWLLLPLVLLYNRKFSIFLVLPLVYLPPPAQAVEWRDLWQTQRQQAVEEYESGNYDSAQHKFTDPLWQGNAAYRAKEYDAAEQAYRQAAQRADEAQRAEALHNLGNALAQQQRYQDALDAYEQALAQQPELAPAKQNADLMKQLLEQQQNQQNQQNQQKDQNNDQQQSDSEQQEKNQQAEEDKANKDESEGEGQQDDKQQTANEQPEPSAAEQKQQEQAAEPSEQQLAEQEDKQQAEQSEGEQQAAVHEAWPNATPEEQQELDNLLRKVQDDPGLLLRNKMYLEYQKRQQYSLPKGADQQW